MDNNKDNQSSQQFMLTKSEEEIAEIILQKTCTVLETYKKETLKELFNITSVEEFNAIPKNTVRIVNGNVEYQEDVICELFAGYLCYNLSEIVGNQNPVSRFGSIIRNIFRIRKNLKIINLNEKIISKNNEIEKKYILPDAPNNAYKQLTAKSQELLECLREMEPEDHADNIQHYGSEEAYISKMTDTYLPQCLESFQEEQKPIIELIKKRNKLLK